MTTTLETLFTEVDIKLCGPFVLLWKISPHPSSHSHQGGQRKSSLSPSLTSHFQENGLWVVRLIYVIFMILFCLAEKSSGRMMMIPLVRERPDIPTVLFLKAKVPQ